MDENNCIGILEKYDLNEFDMIAFVSTESPPLVRSSIKNYVNEAYGNYQLYYFLILIKKDIHIELFQYQKVNKQ